jgi:hypothetical protein
MNGNSNKNLNPIRTSCISIGSDGSGGELLGHPTDGVPVDSLVGYGHNIPFASEDAVPVVSTEIDESQN